MIVYSCIYIMLLLAVFLQYFNKKELAFLCFYLGVLSAIFINAFRDMIGGFDIYVYAQVFEYSDYDGNIFKWEWGFYHFSRLIHFFSGNRYFYFAVLATIFMLSFLRIAQKQDRRFNYYLIFFLIFCKLYFYTFVYLRQNLAMILIWSGFIYYLDNQKIKGRCLSLLSVLFHNSGIISFLMFIKTSIFSKNTVYIFFVLGCLLSFVFSTTQIFSILGGVVENDKASIYGDMESSSNFFYFVEASILCFWLAIRFNVYKLENTKYQIVYNASVFYMFFLLLAVSNATAARFTWYFLIGPLMFIANEININKKNKNLIFLLIIVYFSLIFFRVMTVWDGGDFMPYKSIFSDEPRHGRWEFMEYRLR